MGQETKLYINKGNSERASLLDGGKGRHEARVPTRCLDEQGLLLIPQMLFRFFSWYLNSGRER